jgi:hypothetical protein
MNRIRFNGYVLNRAKARYPDMLFILNQFYLV